MASDEMQELEKSEEASGNLETELELITADFQDELTKGLPVATIEPLFDFFMKIYKRKVLEFAEAKKYENECRKDVSKEELEQREKAQEQLLKEIHAKFARHGVSNRMTQTT